jgi:probable phosphoglycerate mutase
MTARLWIMRHGNTFAAGEAPRRIGARTDLPLTDEGRAQAAALRDRFMGTALARVLSGPLSRTRETAAILGRGEPEIASLLDEIDHGPDEDADEAAVTVRIGKAALSAWDAEAIAPPDWIVAADARIAGWRRLFAEADGDVALVTSNGAARFALLAGGLRPSSFKLRTGAFGRIDVSGGSVELREWDVRP